MITNTEIKKLGRAKGESASLRLSKFVDLKKNSKKPEIEAAIKLHSANSKRIPPFTPKGANVFYAKLGGNLIVNQAGGALENAGICLHPHFNDPYIPGSAVKGIARHAAWCEWHTAIEPQKAKIAKDIAAIFGFPTGDKKGLDAYLAELGFQDTSAGKIAFLAAAPNEEKKPVLMMDIVNCHHMKYYASDDPHAQALDNEAPNPQFFPVVQAGTTFRFTLVPLREDALLEQAKKWLLAAIENHGAGAKTSSGYGWFSEDVEYTQRLQARESAKQQAEAERKAQALEKQRQEEERERLIEKEKAKMSLSPEAQIEAEINSLTEDELYRQVEYPIPADRIVAFCRRFEKEPQLWERAKTKLNKNKKQQQTRTIRSAAKDIGVNLS